MLYWSGSLAVLHSRPSYLRGCFTPEYNLKFNLWVFLTVVVYREHDLVIV